MNQKLLTVNIVTYNYSKYIEQCIESILSQKTNFDFIIRIFDDCSTDGTTEICQKYASNYPDKIYFFPVEKNIGAGENCLRAYQDIETKYYMYIEGDDCLCDNNKFQMQIDILEKYPNCSVCVHNTKMINLGDTTFVTKEQQYLIGLTEGVYTFDAFKEIRFDPHMSSRIARTNCIDHKAGKVFLFDWNNIFLLLEKGDMYYIDKIMSIYNQTGQGIYSGASLNKKFENCVREFYAYDKYTHSKNTKMLHYILVDFIHYLYQNNSVDVNDLEKKEKNRLKLKRIKHYLLPPFLIDIFNLPRDIIRKIKSRGKIRRYFLSPLIIDLCNIPRDVIRKIRKGLINESKI